MGRTNTGRRALSTNFIWRDQSFEHRGYGNLILRVLPPALLATSMLAMTIRLKTLRSRGKENSFFGSAFRVDQEILERR